MVFKIHFVQYRDVFGSRTDEFHFRWQPKEGRKEEEKENEKKGVEKSISEAGNLTEAIEARNDVWNPPKHRQRSWILPCKPSMYFLVSTRRGPHGYSASVPRARFQRYSRTIVTLDIARDRAPSYVSVGPLSKERAPTPLRTLTVHSTLMLYERSFLSAAHALRSGISPGHR